MSMKPHEVEPIPQETARIAWKAFPKGSPIMHLRDSLGPIYEDQQFADLFPKRGRGAQEPWRLALITIFQAMEGLTDRQAAQMVIARIDWKYALSLPLDDEGFDFSVLTDFRQRLLEHGAEERLLEAILAIARQRGWLGAGGKQRTDSTHVVAAVRNLHRLETVGETMRAVLEELAEQAPGWLVSVMDGEWLDRYVHRFELSRFPKAQSQRDALTQQVGEDVSRLLHALQESSTPASVRDLPMVAALTTVFWQHYEQQNGRICWRAGPACKAEDGIISPYDQEARFSCKRETRWLGYKVHLTETCDQREEAPHLITDVHTTMATTTDSTELAPILHELRKRGDGPSEQYVDQGYTSGETLVSQQEQGTQIIGPVASGSSWQKRTQGGIQVQDFEVNWQEQVARCPEGKSSRRWSVREDRRGKPVVAIQFAASDCAVCPLVSQCTSSSRGRTLHLTPQPSHQLLEQRRQHQSQADFQQKYALRAGVEGTIAQGVHMGLRQSRYRGLAKTHLGHVAVAAACNLVRIQQYEQRLRNGKPARPPRPRSSLAALRALREA
jgi:transposase